MDRIAAVLGDTARWRIVELLAERPRSVGELAGLTGLRQPQTTKHLQTLARAGLVTVFPLGQRRVYALEAGPLAALASRLRELADATEAHAGEREALARYRATIEADAAMADRDRWADGRTFAFDRLLPAPPDVVWRHWADPDLLASWWVPPSMTVTACTLEPWPGGRIVLGYRDADGEYHSEGRVRVADEPGHLAFDLAVTGPASFTGDYDLELHPDPDGTRLRLGLRITATTVDAVPFIAGIEPGWSQVLDHLTDVLAKRKG
ncbi:metalloregulator ArsR/SmtB family transcription factor [Amycolatopsis sp. NPDC051045]|uniref:metalloregulator ArsR/SmtB family transcription factor n=1 Tax=Amycolatopsis sp. NPDC051045 TaxID=3156922 RepID=UPI003412EDD8